MLCLSFGAYSTLLYSTLPLGFGILLLPLHSIYTTKLLYSKSPLNPKVTLSLSFSQWSQQNYPLLLLLPPPLPYLILQTPLLPSTIDKTDVASGQVHAPVAPSPANLPSPPISTKAFSKLETLTSIFQIIDPAVGPLQY